MKTDRKIEKKKSPTKEAVTKFHFLLTRFTFWLSKPWFLCTRRDNLLILALIPLFLVIYILFAIVWFVILKN